MSEMAGAPKFLLDAQEGSIYILFAAMPAYRDLHWASVHMSATRSVCTP